MSDTKTIDDGGPAFSRSGFYHNGSTAEYDCHSTDGMSRRDWFAGQALAGYLANKEGWEAKADIIARDCYAIADAFIAKGKEA